MAIVGGPAAAAWAMALNPGTNQYTGLAFSTKACFMVAGDVTTRVNKDRQARPVSSLLIYMSIVPLQEQLTMEPNLKLHHADAC